MADRYFIKYENVIGVPYVAYAHCSEDLLRRETIQEHTNLCEDYFMKIDNARNIIDFFDRVRLLFQINDERAANLYWSLLFNTITFHDYGKINPGFQVERMEQESNIYKSFKWIDGTRHSMLSATIYLNYFISIIENAELSKLVRTYLLGFCLINSYVISRHHSSLSDMQDFINEFLEDGTGYDIFEELANSDNILVQEGFFKSTTIIKKWTRFQKVLDREEGIGIYGYTRFLYSILVTCDYYATTEFKSGTKIDYFGNMESDKMDFINGYESAKLTKKIRTYQREKYVINQKNCIYDNINTLRNEMFIESEIELLKHIDDYLFFLEAPTGSGKSNTAMNLSFKLLQESQNKIYYVYPFNTLIEQNLDSLAGIFDEDNDLLKRIAVINSITPIKMDESIVKLEEEKESYNGIYEKALLDRQFLNYPFILTTHVSLFQTIFGNEKEAVFGFSQLQNSVLVLDEIQSYKNTIWSEIIIFLKSLARLMNMKVIIMSATLPNLNYLTNEEYGVVNLLKDREKYYCSPLFQERVILSYELLERDINMEDLSDHLIARISHSHKILVEFITKKSADAFYEVLLEKNLAVPIFKMTGDDNQVEREAILFQIKTGQGAVLVATQVIEAGVDIDMDIGYKDISKLDSEEQFLGRINRSCKREGKVYFFDLDDMNMVYRNDLRTNKKFTLPDKDIMDILTRKDFHAYYNMVLRLLKENFNQSQNDKWNLQHFFKEKVQGLNFPSVKERMKLIEDKDWDMQVFFNRDILVNEEVINGEEVWNQYKQLLQNNKMGYSEKRVKLSEIRGKLTYFTYSISKKSDLLFSDRIGELYYISDSEQYFKNGKLNRKKLEMDGAVFFL